MSKKTNCRVSFISLDIIILNCLIIIIDGFLNTNLKISMSININIVMGAYLS